jgi:hypothetical protein
MNLPTIFNKGLKGDSFHNLRLYYQFIFYLTSVSSQNITTMSKTITNCLMEALFVLLTLLVSLWTKGDPFSPAQKGWHPTMLMARNPRWSYKCVSITAKYTVDSDGALGGDREKKPRNSFFGTANKPNPAVTRGNFSSTRSNSTYSRSTCTHCHKPRYQGHTVIVREKTASSVSNIVQMSW